MTKDEHMAFEAALLVRAAAIETELRLLLGGRTLAGEIARPERLMAAMRHGVLNGGKRAAVKQQPELGLDRRRPHQKCGFKGHLLVFRHGRER